MNMKQSIIKKAKDIGIDVIGFTSCEPLSHMIDVLKEREAMGYLSGFEERDIQKRVNPGLFLKGCSTIISAGISYYIDEGKVDKKTGHSYKCRISRSSWGSDYHHVLKDKLNKLSSFISDEYKSSTMVFVDEGPMLEREIARRAGVGYIGKNCSLINPEYGSYIFIGEILTNLYIVPDSPLEESCGDCDLCLRACPSKALCGPYVIDAKRCISYITQSRDIPYDRFGSIGSSIYGCDVCQDVCPKNKNIGVSHHGEFMPQEWNCYPDAAEILNMDNKAYAHTFKGTSSGWRGKKTLQRNAIIALGNSGNMDNSEYIIKMLSDSRRDIREVSVVALYNLLGNGCRDELLKHLENENDEKIKKLVLNLLDKM